MQYAARVDNDELEQREFRNEVVRLADLTVNTDKIVKRRFENCQIIGPAVIVPLDGTSISHCSWDAPGPDAILWLVPRERSFVIGAIGVIACEFFKCKFVSVGIAVTADDEDRFRRALEGGD